MDRRRYIALMGAAALAGCASEGSDQESTTTTAPSTTTTTTTETSTETTTPPANRPPTIDTVSLISRWDEFGDAKDHQLQAMGRGALAIVGFRYMAGVHNGTANYTEQVKVYGPDGNRVAIDQSTDEQLVDETGYSSWEHALYFETESWDLGEYTAEVLIRDNEINATSDTGSTEFTVNRPLTEGDAELVNVIGPDSIQPGERYEFTLELMNTSARDGSVVSPWSVKWESGLNWSTYDTEVTASVAAGETNEWSGYVEGLEDEGTVIFRLDEIGQTWQLEVSS